jgi:hypothetical protein
MPSRSSPGVRTLALLRGRLRPRPRLEFGDEPVLLGDEAGESSLVYTRESGARLIPAYLRCRILLVVDI